MPKSIKHMAKFAKLLLVVLSLRRMILMNYDKLNMVLEAKQMDELEMLLFKEDDDDFNLHSDSTTMTSFDDEHEEFEVQTSIIDSHLEKSLLDDIDNLEYGSGVKSYDQKL